MSKILLVEDDRDLTSIVSHRLSAAGHIVEVVHDGSQGLDFMRTGQFDLVVLDWNIPIMSGLEVLNAYRSEGGRSAVLMLTARADVNDRLSGFERGADDYLPKPFDMRELLFRIQALLRRPPVSGSNVLRFLDITLDPMAHIAKRGETEIHLQRQDFVLLEFLMRHPDEVFNAETLMARAWHNDSSASINGLRMSILRLRKAIDDPAAHSLIENIPRVGYRLRMKQQ